MANQIIIDIGAVANDGTGDPLRTAFGYVNDNFSNVWATGVANSNVAFSGNKILTTNTNGNLVLAPNGIGKVQANVDIIPNANNTLSLGALGKRWNTVYAQYLDVANITVSGDVDLAGDVVIDGNLTVNGTTTTLNTSNVDIEDKQITLAFGSPNVTVANGAGIHVAGANANITYLSSNDSWNLNKSLSVNGNISTFTGNVQANYFIGNGSQLTSVAAAGGNTQIQFNNNGVLGVANYGLTYNNASNTFSVVTGSFFGDATTGRNALYAGTAGYTALGSDIMAQFTGNVDAYSQINFQNINNGTSASGDFIVTADNGTDSTNFVDMGIASSTYSYPSYPAYGPNDSYLLNNGGNLLINSQSPSKVIKLLVGGSANSNIVATVSNIGMDIKGNIIPTTSNTYSLGNSTNQWSDLYVSNATIYMNNIPISLTAGNVLTVDGEPVLINDSNTSISTSGNITADYFFGDGSQLSNVGGNTGNIGFDNYNIYNTQGGGIIFSNFNYLTEEAETAWIEIPAGNSTTPLRIVQEQGNVGVVANSQVWTFDTTGILTVPLTSGGASNQIKYGTGNLVVWNDGGWALGVYDGTDVGTEGMRLSPGIEGNVEVILPANQDAATNPLGLNNYAGNVQINANNHYWTFGADGTTTFPENTIAQTTNTNLEVQTASGGSLVFSRASGGSYLQTSDPIAFNGQPWSFETYVYLEDTGKNILAGVDTLPGLNIYFDGTTFNVQSDDVLINTWSNVVPSLNTWHHIAVGYNGEGINAWLDGAQLTGGQQTTAAAGGDYGNNVLYVGATPWDESAGSAMRITNLRIVAGGTTLYDPNSATITVPPPKLTVVADTQLLLLADTEATAYDDSTGNYGITPTRMTWSSGTPSITAGTNNWQFSNQGNLYLPNNGVIATSGNNIVITNSSLLDGDITIQANASVTVSGGDSDAPNTYGGWVYVSGGNGGPDSGVGVGGGGSVEVSGGLGANAISDAAGEGGEVRITGGAGGTANDGNSVVAGNGGPVYIFGGQAGDVDNGNAALAVNGPAVEIHGGLGSFAGTNMIGRPGDVLTQGGGNGWIGASGNVYSKTSPDGYGFYTWGYINNGQTLYPIQSVQRGDTTSGTISGYALVGGAGDQEFIISTPNGSVTTTNDSQRLVINPGKGADGTNGEGGDIYLWAGRGGSGDEANAVSAGSGGDIKIRGGQGGGYNGDGGYIRIEAGDASSTGGASGYIDITGGNSAVSAGGRVAITGGQGVTTGGDANITGGYGSGGNGGNVNIVGGSSSLGAGHYGNVIINTGNAGNTWTFDQYGNLNLPQGTAYIGSAANSLSLHANDSEAIYISDISGGISAETNGNITLISNVDGVTNYAWTFDNTGTLTAPGNVSAGNFVGNGSNVDIVAGAYNWTFDNTGNIQGNVSLTGPNITVNNAGGGNEGSEIAWALPAAANTTLTTSVVQDVYQNSMRFFEGGGTNRGLVMDIGNAPEGTTAAVGYRDVPQITLSANVTANATNAGRHFYSTTAGNLSITLPDNANVAYPLGATLTVVVNAAGNVLVNQGTGVSLYMAGSSSTGNRVVGAYGLASVMKVATNTWVISGTGVY